MEGPEERVTGQMDGQGGKDSRAESLKRRTTTIR